MGLEGPKDATMVPFKWEEAPGKPMGTSSCNELVPYTPSSLQLPPKLQSCQANQSPLHSSRRSPCQESPLTKNLTQPINQPLFRSSPNKKILKRLSTYMLKTTSCSAHAPPLHKFMSHHSWSNPPCIDFSSSTLHQYKEHDKLAFNDRLFFDRYSPKDLRYCASMDSILPTFEASPHQREDEFVSSKALSFLAMEEEHEEAESTTTASSPWHHMSFHEREGSPSRWQPMKFSEKEGSPYLWQPAPTIKVHSKLAQEEHDEDDDEGFHDLFSSTASSSMKPSQRTDDDGMESASSSPSPWYLDFSPEEEEVHVERRGSKLTLVAFIKLKKVILRKVISKLKRSGEGANHQSAESTMWSPTLATYLYNQQLEEEKQIKTPISSPISTNSDDGHSELGSNRLQIDPNYYLPRTIRTHLMNPKSDDEDLTPREARKSSFNYLAEEEERHNLRDSTHKLSLREQLAEFDDDEYLAPSFYEQRNRDTRTFAGHPDNSFNEQRSRDAWTFVGHPDNNFKAKEPPACKGMCKVRKTVKVLASTIKLILVQTETGKRKGAQISLNSCVKPTLSRCSSFQSTRR